MANKKRYYYPKL